MRVHNRWLRVETVDCLLFMKICVRSCLEMVGKGREEAFWVECNRLESVTYPGY